MVVDSKEGTTTEATAADETIVDTDETTEGVATTATVTLRPRPRDTTTVGPAGTMIDHDMTIDQDMIDLHETTETTIVLHGMTVHATDEVSDVLGRLKSQNYMLEYYFVYERVARIGRFTDGGSLAVSV